MENRNLIISWLVLLSAITMFFGCSKIETEPGNKNFASTIVCNAPENTKSYVDGMSVKWQANDELYVIPGVNKDATYTLSEGAGTNCGKFTYKSGVKIEEGTPIAAITGYKKLGWYNGIFYFDIEGTPKLYGCDGSSSLASGTELKIPMLAIGDMGENLNFQHVSSMIRLDVKNSTGKDLNISKILLTTDEHFLSSRLAYNPTTNRVTVYRSSDFSDITSSGDVKLEAGSQKSFDFVITADTHTNLNVQLLTDEGDLFHFHKNGLVAAAGEAYRFSTVLSPDSRAYLNISVDGSASVPYVPGSAFIPQQSVKITPGNTSLISTSDIEMLLAEINKSENIVSFDLSDVELAFVKSWAMGCSATNIGDFYFPKNITRVTTYDSFANCSDMKMHITSKITNVGEILFGSKKEIVHPGCGFFVDESHATYSSEGGILYSKDGKTIIQRPIYESDVTGVVIKEGVVSSSQFGITNNHLATSITLPVSFTGDLGANAFQSLPNVTKIICKSPSPANLTSNKIGAASPGTASSGLIIIDTGTPALDETAKADYQTAWGPKIGAGWQIVTKAESIELETQSKASLSDLNANNSYSTSLW